MHNWAKFSDDRIYRYWLRRRWDSEGPYVLFIGLNPSTADERTDDPTIRRCVRFAKDWGYGAVVMANLFAIRATDPKDMQAHPEPIGPDNNEWLRAAHQSAGLTVCAWGAQGTHLRRDRQVQALLGDQHLVCLGVTKDGHPRHPLYIKADTLPEPLPARPWLAAT